MTGPQHDPQRRHGADPTQAEPDDVAEFLADVGKRSLTRREVLRRGVALGLTVPAIGWLLAACGGDDDDDDDDDSGTGDATPTQQAGATTTAGTPQGGGRLTLVVPDNIPDLDPQSAYDSTASAVFFGTYEMLVRLKGSDTFEYEPMFAREWSSNEDFSEWTFILPENATFHDGSPADAEAVAKSFQRFLQMGLGPVNVISRFVEKPEDITAVDKTTLKFKLITGNEIFIAAMASQYGPLIVSPAAVEANKKDGDEWAHEWFLQNAVGTGPYKLKEIVQNDRIVLERFAEYHRGWDGPHFDEIVFRIVPEPSTRRQLVESGDADALTQSLNPADVAAIEETGDLAVLRYDSTNANWITMNAGAKLADPKVRQAFCYAFPYEEVRSGVFEGLVTKTSGPCTPTTRGYDTNGFIYETDLDKAKQMLEEAGWDFSEPLEYTIDSGDAVDPQIAQLFQANLQQIGLTMNIIQMEGGALSEFNYGESPPEERSHFVSWGWWPDYNDAWNEIHPNFHTESIVPNGSNIMYYSNARLDEILDTVSPGVSEDEYTKLMAEANKILVEDDPAAIFYGSVQWYTVMNPKVKGFIPNPIYINTYNVYDMYRES